MPRVRAKPVKKADPKDWTEALTRFGEWLVDHEKSAHTQNNYRADLLIFTAWYQSTYEDMPILALLQPSELREFRTHLREGQKLEPATVNRKLSALRSFLRWAEEAGLAPEIRTPKAIERVIPPPRWLAPKEQRRLIRAVNTNGGLRDRAIIAILLNTVLRVEELADLQWRDVTVKERSGLLIVRKGKGRKQREIPLNADARDAIHQLRELVGTATKTESSLLTGQQGEMKVRGIQLIVSKFGRLAQLENVSPHVLRHTFGKNMADAGVRMEVIADLMGHESLETTRRYVQPGRADLASAVERISGGIDDDGPARRPPARTVQRQEQEPARRRADLPGQGLIPGFGRGGDKEP